MGLAVGARVGGSVNPFPIPDQGVEPALPACLHLSPTQNTGSSAVLCQNIKQTEASGDRRGNTHPSQKETHFPHVGSMFRKHAS